MNVNNVSYEWIAFESKVTHMYMSEYPCAFWLWERDMED